MSIEQEDIFHLYTLDRILVTPDYSKKRTKIICTIGPACDNVETLVKMIDLGMNVARLNFSHGSHESHGETVKRLREAFRVRKDKPCSILLDTKGPEVRTGFLKDHKAVELKEGQDVEIVTDYEFLGDNTKFACSYDKLPQSVKVGGQIQAADGTIVLTVKECKETSVICEVMNNCKLGERKNMNQPGVHVQIPTITEKDEDDIINFALKKGVDFIALSFVQRAQDVEDCRDILGVKGSNIKIISKIENQEGLENYEAILKASDGIMVARGDLGMEIPTQKVFVAQKWMTKKGNLAGKPVITATQMLESMIQNPRPTRAEASDVANAVLDGTDVVMLSGETANGAHPLNAVEIMAKLAVEAEATYPFKINFRNMLDFKHIKLNKTEAMCQAAVQIAFELDAPAIVCFTETGHVGRLISKYKPRAYIICVSVEDKVIKGQAINSGVVCLKVPSFQGIDAIVKYAVKEAMKKGYAKEGDRLVLVSGQNEEHPDDQNIMKILTATEKDENIDN